MTERLTPIVYKNRITKFQISDMGIVYNENLEPVKPYTDNRGYLHVSLYQQFDDGFIMNDRFLVHRLVAMAYIPNPENLPTVNHLNVIFDDVRKVWVSNKLDNRYYMLEWASYSDNNIHALKNNLRVPLSCDKHQYATLTNQQVESICQMLQDNCSYEEIIDKLELSNIDNIKRKLIMIKTRNSWTDISRKYNFPEYKLSSNPRYTIDQIKSICELLQQGITDYGEILATVNIEDTRASRKTVSVIKNRTKYKKISMNYKW